MHSYRLVGAQVGEENALPYRLLVTLAQWKIRRFLETGLRLRTACDLAVATDDVLGLPSLTALSQELRELIGHCSSAGLFASPAVRILDLPRSEIKVRKEATAEGQE